MKLIAKFSRYQAGLVHHAAHCFHRAIFTVNGEGISGEMIIVFDADRFPVETIEGGFVITPQTPKITSDDSADGQIANGQIEAESELDNESEEVDGPKRRARVKRLNDVA